MILAAHISETPEPVTKHREAVPAALNQLVMKCLEKKAADRWQSAEDLLPQLEVLATPSGGSHQRWAPDGDRLVYDMGNVIGLVTPAGEETQLLDGAAAGFVDVVKPDWSRDGRFVYFSGVLADGSAALYSIPAAGGQPQLLVRYDDPTKQVFLWGFSVGDGKVYLTVSEYESDIYVMDLAIN